MDLHIYVAGHCPVSAYSLELAADVRGAFPHVNVAVVDVEQIEAALPDDVLFTPSYFLNGQPIHWGNPTRESLFGMLRRESGASIEKEEP